MTTSRQGWCLRCTGYVDLPQPLPHFGFDLGASVLCRLQRSAVSALRAFQSCQAGLSGLPCRLWDSEKHPGWALTSTSLADSRALVSGARPSQRGRPRAPPTGGPHLSVFDSACAIKDHPRIPKDIAQPGGFRREHVLCSPRCLAAPQMTTPPRRLVILSPGAGLRMPRQSDRCSSRAALRTTQKIHREVETCFALVEDA